MNKNFRFIYLLSIPFLLCGCSTDSTFNFVSTSTGNRDTSTTSASYDTDYETQITRGISEEELGEIIASAKENMSQIKTKNTNLNEIVYSGEESSTYTLSYSTRLFNNDVLRTIYTGTDESKGYFDFKEDIENGGYLSEYYTFAYDNHKSVMATYIYTIENSSYEHIVTEKLADFSLYNYSTYFQIGYSFIIPDLVDENGNNVYNPIAGYLPDGRVYASVTDHIYNEVVNLYFEIREEFIFNEDQLVVDNLVTSAYSDANYQNLVSCRYSTSTLSYVNNGSLTDVPSNIESEEDSTSGETSTSVNEEI